MESAVSKNKLFTVWEDDDGKYQVWWEEEINCHTFTYASEMCKHIQQELEGDLDKLAVFLRDGNMDEARKLLDKIREEKK
jgi:hypothetical protein